MTSPENLRPFTVDAFRIVQGCRSAANPEPHQGLMSGSARRRSFATFEAAMTWGAKQVAAGKGDGWSVDYLNDYLSNRYFTPEGECDIHGFVLVDGESVLEPGRAERIRSFEEKAGATR